MNVGLGLGLGLGLCMYMRERGRKEVCVLCVYVLWGVCSGDER